MYARFVQASVTAGDGGLQDDAISILRSRDQMIFSLMHVIGPMLHLRQNFAHICRYSEESAWLSQEWTTHPLTTGHQERPRQWNACRQLGAISRCGRQLCHICAIGYVPFCSKSLKCNTKRCIPTKQQVMPSSSSGFSAWQAGRTLCHEPLMCQVARSVNAPELCVDMKQPRRALLPSLQTNESL